MIKSVILWNLPEGWTSEEFERKYFTEHVPLMQRRPGVSKYVVTKFLPNADGTPPKFYRMAEVYYPDLEAMEKARNSNVANIARQQLKDWKWRDLVSMSFSEEVELPLDDIREGE
jgi:uncharacterized protein (TIGR02118 family)